MQDSKRKDRVIAGIMIADIKNCGGGSELIKEHALGRRGGVRQ